MKDPFLELVAKGVRPRNARRLIARRYHRHNLGGGNTLKAVTRTRRSAPGRKLGTCPDLKSPVPNWRAHRRRALAKLQHVVADMEAREQ